MINRVILIVLDSVGVGEMPDAIKYGDEGANTLQNIWNKFGGLKIPNLLKLGIGNIDGLNALPKTDSPLASYGRMAEASEGKDTITGHWEIAGIELDIPFKTYPNGFPKDIIDEFKNRIGTEILGNVVASGTEIIESLGKEHIETGFPIVYTSADSVFQIAAHEEVISVEKLYDICKVAREILVDEHNVARVIARPFIGKTGSFTRTTNRKDLAVKPYTDTMLDNLYSKGYRVMTVGKIDDIFCGRGITDSIHTKGNSDGIDKTIDFIRENKAGLIFSNLVDFDMLYGHRNDYKGYGEALEYFDTRLPEIISQLKSDDVLVITADHGCDPTIKGTDHTREYVPVIIYGEKIRGDQNIGTRNSFADLGATICDLLEADNTIYGKSFKGLLLKED